LNYKQNKKNENLHILFRKANIYKKMIQIIIFLISVVCAHSFSAHDRLPDYKIPKWAKKHFRDNKLTLNGLNELKKIKQSDIIDYEIPDWAQSEVFNYNKHNNIFSLNALKELKQKQNNIIDYEIPNWANLEVFDYNKHDNMLQ